MKRFKNFFGFKQSNENQKVMERVKERLAHIKRKLSRGAADLSRMIRTRSKWGFKDQNPRGKN